MNAKCDTCWYWVQTDSESDGVCTNVESEFFNEETSCQIQCEEYRPLKIEAEP